MRHQFFIDRYACEKHEGYLREAARDRLRQQSRPEGHRVQGRSGRLPTGLVRVGLWRTKWLLPWTGVLLVSATLAYAMNIAIAGGPSAGDQRPDVQVAVSTGEAIGPAAVERSTTSPSAQSADLGPIVTPERCASIGSGYMDSSIVAEMRKTDCGWAP